MNGKIVGETIENVAASISGSKWWKRLSTSSDEIAETIANNPKLGIGNAFEDDLATKLRSGMGMEGEMADSIAKKIHPSIDIDKTADRLAKKNGLDERAADTLKRFAKETAENSKIKTSDMGLLQKAAEYPRAYFGIADKATRQTRIATAAGAYAGVAVGSRLLSGGSLTKDEYGRGDIAGIPFI